MNPPNPELTRVGFTGQDQDVDLGLTDMKGRIYDPLAGRFMSQDPVMQAPFWSQGLNRYSYVFNNPVNNTDPSGFESEGAGATEWLGATSALIVGGTAAEAFSPGFGAALSVLGAGGNSAVPFIGGGGLAGSARAGGSYSVTPTATARSANVSRQSVQATGQLGQLGPAVSPRKPPSLCDVGICLAQSTAGAQGGPGYQTMDDGTGGGVPEISPKAQAIVYELISLAGQEVSAVINIIVSVEQHRQEWLAKAPGVPNAADGFVPPKNWNGKTVRNPNGPGVGYPDSRGRVWVPTGTGPLAHGGPHWDVQEPGGGYTNVYPGGKVR